MNAPHAPDYRQAPQAPQWPRRTPPSPPSLRLLAMLQEGVALDEQGHVQQAMSRFQQATQHHPDSADAWAALGMTQYHLFGAAAAEASFQRALQIDPGRVDVIEKFGIALQEQRRYEDAALVFERLLQLAPAYPLAAGRLLHCKMLIADWTRAETLQARVEQAIESGHNAAEPFGLQGYCRSPSLLRRAAAQYSATYHPPRRELQRPPVIGYGPKIRIGYVSGEFRQQATSILLTQVLELHDRSRFDIVAFDNGWDDGSPLRRRIEACVDELVPIRGLPHLAAAQAVRERGVDVLVNLNGHFGQARSHLFALRPAPLQVNYLGFPGTIGAPYIDYLIADHTVIPEAQRMHYVEKIAYLPDCYQPNDSTRQIAATPARRSDIGLPEDAFVFCCLNNVYKIVPAVFDVWMRVLRQVPRSVLMLYSDTPATQDNLRREAQARGVAAGRLHFAGNLPHDQHLARLRLADLFLDTWPYNAHTTGSDALWAGLPVLTCAGETFPSRVGASLLQTVGLPELVTHTPVAYEALAVTLATQSKQLIALREKLAAQLSHSLLYDTRRYTRNLEGLYHAMVDRARAGLPPALLR
ncbi:tetratricopeptide repeat protein [Piscinibacter sp. HJYY11]|uniref:O-linked N-acetylglucosamine transferase, SPINDLY family protein n=1 Tax=Piscinibacter sp. HJYY11 TaxID=2801333 RepID=UPI00191C9750|nr:tetratricopeptide repeat protein [Piscinibacter sp. HJYY11]MBL0726185.1 tetratricopeptide repeat protein [Piscinibacter sp. HJYY11]